MTMHDTARRKRLAGLGFLTGKPFKKFPKRLGLYVFVIFEYQWPMGHRL
jgi:hypothetical protein